MTSSTSMSAAEPMVSVSDDATHAISVHYRFKQIGNVKVFYREAGNPEAPTILLLHGFAASSFMFRDLIPRLADRYHLIAPDLPAFGFTEAPARDQYAYTFSQLAETISQFTEQLNLNTYALMVHDYGAPVGWRLAVAHPQRVTAIISQNGNAYEEGLGEGWATIQNTGANPHSKIGMLCMTFRPRPRLSGNTLRELPIRVWFHLMATRLKGCRYCGRAMRRFNSIWCWIMPRTWRCILPSSDISVSISHHYWPFGEDTIRFSSLRALRPGNVTYPRQTLSL